jgi:cadmium resistance protein CadD (predicted permease)
VHNVLLTVGVALSAFVGTMIDNTLAVASQFAVSDAVRHERIARGHVFGIVTLIAISAGVGTALSTVPVRWVGVLAAAPIALAIHAWRNAAPGDVVPPKGLLSTWLVTVALGGDNIAVWTPLLRADGAGRALLSVGVFIVCDLAVVRTARSLAHHPRIMDRTRAISTWATPPLYIVLAVVIMWECRWFS